MVLRYTTVQSFWKFMGINERILSFQPGSEPLKETVASSPVTAGDYYLNQLGVNEDTLNLYAGGTTLTLTTHYTFDSDTSKITITAAGATALSGFDLTADYEYSAFGEHLNYNETVAILTRAESRVDKMTNTTFADETDTNPSYRKIVDEYHKGQGSKYIHYKLNSYPIVKLQTTVNGAYTTGGTEITLTDASKFPTSGNIYIGGNKVSYTGKTSNTLTIPSTTPSISDSATVRGEVIEINLAGSNESGSFLVLDPDTDYEIDYITGKVQLQNSTYFTDTNLVSSANWNSMPPYGVQNRFRATFMTAFYEKNQAISIPDEIVEVVYMMAGRQLAQQTVLKSLAGQRDNFNPQSFAFSKKDIEERLECYRLLL